MVRRVKGKGEGERYSRSNNDALASSGGVGSGSEPCSTTLQGTPSSIRRRRTDNEVENS